MTCHCGVCDRTTGPLPASRRRLGVTVCPRCYNREVVIRTALDIRKTPFPYQQPIRVYTFYVSSLTRPKVEYTVKRFRRQVTCSCPDYIHRGQVLGIPCKHVRLIRLLVRAVGSWTSLPKGSTLRFRLADPLPKSH